MKTYRFCNSSFTIFMSSSCCSSDLVSCPVLEPPQSVVQPIARIFREHSLSGGIASTPANISFEYVRAAVNMAALPLLHRQSFFYVPNTCICGKEKVKLDGSDVFHLQDPVLVCRQCSRLEHHCSSCRRQTTCIKTALTETISRYVFDSSASLTLMV